MNMVDFDQNTTSIGLLKRGKKMQETMVVNCGAFLRVSMNVAFIQVWEDSQES